jgi:hypothetical protein
LGDDGLTGHRGRHPGAGGGDVRVGDYEGGQRVISRFAVIPVGDDRWLATVSRHWNIDRPDPR